MRLFTATVATETNTFSPIPTSLANFHEAFYAPPGHHPADPNLCTAPLVIGRRRARAEDFELVEGTCAWAEPAGTCTRAAYEHLRDEILDQLRPALPVDGVLLGLHGAMVADGYDDCEGDLVARVRELVGDKAVIGVEHDPHCHLTEKRLRASDLLVTFKEFPHTDTVERAEEVVDLTLRAIRGEIRPVMSCVDCRTIASFPTTREPMRSFVDRIKSLEGKDGVLSISIAHGFPYADVPEMGARILVITDDAKAKGDALAAELAADLVAMRGRTAPPYLTPDQAIDEALAMRADKPVVIADPTDNPGGGAPGDSTQVLARLLERQVEGAVLGPLWDPIAVRFCFAAGEGARLPLRFGGKTAPSSGQPIDAEVEVVRCVADAHQSFGGGTMPLGDTARIRLGGVEVVLISKRTQALGLDLFTGVGVDLGARRIVSVKSTNHCHAAFAPIASAVLYTDGGGPIPRDPRKVPYIRVARPIWPLDEVAGPRAVL
ncbi:MAG: M81 family metallopeptidase [Pseudomonadota bacterium]